MTPAGPKLTFFVELEVQPLEELFERPDVLPFLTAQRCAVSMGLIDLSPRRAAVVRRLESNGIPVTGWLLLDVEDGYWLNADNADSARDRWRETAAWAESEGFSLSRVGLDIEFPRSESEGAIRDKRRAFFSMLRRRRTREQVREAERAYGELVREIRQSGRSVEVYQFPYLLDERAAGSTLLRRALGVVDVAVGDGRGCERRKPGGPASLPLAGAARGGPPSRRGAHERGLRLLPRGLCRARPAGAHRGDRLGPARSNAPPGRGATRPEGAPDHAVALPRGAALRLAAPFQTPD
jgi:hypothetical protein